MKEMHPATAALHAEAARLFRPLAGEPNPFTPVSDWRGGADEISLDGFESEADISAKVLSRLDPWFEVSPQVHGRHYTGVDCYVDAVIRPRDPQAWHNPNIAMGIEFKRSAQGSRKDITSWVAQSIDYAYIEWDGFGRIPVFMCPNPFPSRRSLKDPLDPLGFFVDGLLAQFSVGYVALYRGYGLSLVLQGTHKIWSERYGVREGRNWSLHKRVGSR
ncbi:hypothetical protein AB0442_02145 [Kitasatospora sp. NPDC085895]|uniref:hypothetical protein n=1 Tax=Kitasatospora sp. NPDC085895 TaxID=3155057 RepID=UPI00344D1246